MINFKLSKINIVMMLIGGLTNTIYKSTTLGKSVASGGDITYRLPRSMGKTVCNEPISFTQYSQQRHLGKTSISGMLLNYQLRKLMSLGNLYTMA